MKKKILPAWRPPKFVNGASRSYINVYYTDKNGVKQHKKPTFSLGRIWNIEQRRIRGEELERKIFWWLQQGFFFEDFDEAKVDQSYVLVEETKPLSKTFLCEAMIVARDVKISQTKKRSVVNNVNSDTRMFLQYLDLRELSYMYVGEFRRSDAMAYLVYYLNDRKCSNTTYNNVISKMRKLFTVLVDLGYTEANPFSSLKSLEPEEPNIRDFDLHESKLVRDYIYQNDRVLFYAVLIQLGCFVRPNELRNLRFEDLLIEEGLIRVRADEAKKSKTRFSTIPEEVFHFFQEEYFSAYPGSFFVFGSRNKPNPIKPIGRDTLSKRHKSILDELHDKGLLLNREGLSFYSWKYTGITEGIEQMGLVAASEQAGHSNVKTTMRYRKKKKVNKKMRKFKLS